MPDTQPWTFAGEPAGGGDPSETVTLLAGSTFAVSDANGDIRPDRAQGLFVRDTRILSHWQLRVDGSAPVALAVHHESPFRGTFLARMPPRPGRADNSLLVIRHRYVGEGMREDVTLRNLGPWSASLRIELDAGSDFADLFEVKEGHRTGPAAAPRAVPSGGGLRITGRRGPHVFGLTLDAEPRPDAAGGPLSWQVDVPARGQWTTSVEVLADVDGITLPLGHPRGTEPEYSLAATRLRDWRRHGPEVSTADPTLAAVLARSVEDLGALRIFDPEHPQRAVVAAGAPWFMALFGRDSLLTSWMVLPLDASLAIGTLQTLAEHQGRTVDPASEEQPGRILHEIRFGPASGFAAGGRSVYYGSVDATPLFVMLLGELQRWGADAAQLAGLLEHADRALNWIDEYGDADGDGFVEYERASETGLANQGWKDSWDAIGFADGRLARAPIALSEVQGYCYAAFRARAHFAAGSGDEGSRRYWRDRAAQLKARFNEAFWLPQQGFYAVGLDADKRPIDAVTSNIGHCLWTGIVDQDKAPAVAERLLSPEMFSGWGIRTLATSMRAYNPISYHNGSVWPHDNALAVAGLMRYGLVDQAQRVVTGLVDASQHFGHRLPELFCGFSRAEFAAPVRYPSSCTPQAWAAASPFLLLRALLRFDPELPVRQLFCSPEMPERYLPLRIAGLHVAGLDVEVSVHPSGWRVAGLQGSGLTLVCPEPGTARLDPAAGNLAGRDTSRQ